MSCNKTSFIAGVVTVASLGLILESSLKQQVNTPLEPEACKAWKEHVDPEVCEGWEEHVEELDNQQSKNYRDFFSKFNEFKLTAIHECADNSLSYFQDTTKKEYCDRKKYTWMPNDYNCIPVPRSMPDTSQKVSDFMEKEYQIEKLNSAIKRQCNNRLSTKCRKWNSSRLCKKYF